MKLKKARTCNRCCAIEEGCNSWEFRCQHGFKIKVVSTSNGRAYKPTPQERCPKPLTYEQWLFVRKNLERLKRKQS